MSRLRELECLIKIFVRRDVQPRQVVGGDRRPGVDREHPLVFLSGLDFVALCFEQHREHRARRDRRRIHLQHRLKALLRLLQPVLTRVQLAEQAIAVEPCGVELNRLVEEALTLVELIDCRICAGGHEQQIGVRVDAGHRCIETGRRLVRPVRGEINPRDSAKRFQIVRVQLQRPLV